MNQTQENVTGMFEATLKFLDEHNNVWSGKSAFTDAVGEARTGVQAIREAASTQETSTIGVTDRKTQTRHDLEEQTLEMADQLAALAAKKSNAGLAPKVQLSRSSLDIMQDNDLVQTAQQIYDLANANATDLKPYGVTTEQMTGLKTTTEAFDDMKNASRSAFAGKTSATGSVGEMIRKTRSLFRNQLDKMVTPFRKTNAEFYRGYFAARVIVDRVATHATAKAPTPPPTTAMPSAAKTPGATVS